ALSAIILPAHIQETETRIMQWLHRVYMPLLHWAISSRRIVMASAGLLVILTFVAVRMLGLEFLPKLEEGNLWIR
ncbi:efflux RND transporter permease subunit, partial [Escherichia fergusonii]